MNWNDLHLIQTLAGASSLRKASRASGIALNTIRSRIERLEKSLGTTLFVRNSEGLRPTAEGRSVLSVAKDMRSVSDALPHGRGNNVLVRDGEVRICVSEGVGTFWLTPRLPALKQAVPDLVVALDCFSDQSRINPGDYDLAIGFNRPTGHDAVIAKLATVHMMAFASESYLREYGMPLSLDDPGNHKCVQQDAPGLNYGAARFFFSSEELDRLVSIRVSSSYSLYWAVASGVGIGVLPTYMRAISKRVRPLDLPLRMKFELWLSYGQASRHSEPVRRTIDWLRASFDPAAYPWFADRFVHPDDFGAPFHDSQVVPLFDHIIDDPMA